MRRSVWVAALASAAFLLVVAIPTDLIDTPLFSREIPPTWWAWPALLVTSVLGGLITATYVRPAAGPERSTTPATEDLAPGRGFTLAGVLTFLAVGCPVCNKLVLLAVGTSGALTWFAPVQPVLQVAALALLAWALVRRLRNQSSCSVPSASSVPRDSTPMTDAHLDFWRTQ